MKYLCEACAQLVLPTSFRVEGARLVMVCSSCAAETRLAPEASAGAPAGASAPAAAPGPEALALTQPMQLSAELLTAARLSVDSTQPMQLSAELLAAASPAPRRPAARAPAAVQGDPFLPPPGHCPKCIAPRPARAQACPQCGLTYALFQPEAHRPSAPVATAWQEVLARWEEREAHDRLLSLALERQELAEVGRLYRIRLALEPQDGMARRGLDEVLRLATTAAGALTPSQPGLSPQTRMKLILATLLLGLGVTLLFMALR